MDPLTVAAAGGMQARMQSLDMLANNLANTETGGYKTDREFYNLFLSAEAGPGGAPSLPVIERPWTDFSQGTLRVTGSPADLALTGPGFFAVEGSAGPLYTRNGSFQVSSDGSLVTSEGFAVRTVSGKKLGIQPAGVIEIAADGTVAQNGVALGRLEIADFDDPDLLTKQGGSYFVSSETPHPAPAAVQQGKLENSNVGAAESAVRLVAVMREFEMLQKAATLGSQMNRETVEEVARVAS